MISIVGLREASPQGLKNCRLFSQALSRAGALIVSGIAKWGDSAVHQAVIDLGAGHFTAAVLGTGVDVVYPLQNLSLSHAIRHQGLLISELPLGIAPKK